ncbi:MAG: PEP-CTERM sorting domain-containing protein [Rubritalea sp.]
MDYYLIQFAQEEDGLAGTTSIDNFSITAVPEPSSTALLGLGGLALIMRRRK